MAGPPIVVDGVSKRFRRSGVPRSLKESIVKRRSWGPSEEFWALKDVSLEVHAGETLGVVGDNGSGKSTLLKLIAGILRPTSGSIAVNGAMAPLLELGVGFHGDLSGRENIFLNGAILGIERKEMQSRLARIVDFAELWPFIDTPVRAYSSGMVVRLGFAIAVQVEPQILLVDEVLAVGDRNFQAKCYDAIGELKARGTTIVFVTHAHPLVQRLCSRAVWIREGEIVSEGTPDKVVGDYTQHVEARDEAATVEVRRAQDRVAEVAEATSSGRGRIIALQTVQRGAPAVVLDAGEPAAVTVGFAAGADGGKGSAVGASVFSVDGVRCFRLETGAGELDRMVPSQVGTVEFSLETLPLATGTYHVTVELRDAHGLADLHDRAYTFKVRSASLAWGTVWTPYRTRLGLDPVPAAPEAAAAVAAIDEVGRDPIPAPPETAE